MGVEVDFEITKLFKVTPEVYPQVDIRVLAAALNDPDDPKKEPRSADDILFEPIQEKEPEPARDDSVLDEYLYEGMSLGCGCDDCDCACIA